jgi:hypothetical protein
MPDTDTPKTARARLRSLRRQLLAADDREDFADLLRGDLRDALPADEHTLLDRIWWVINGGLHEDAFTPDQRWAVLLAVASEDWTRDYEPPTDADEWRELRDGLWSTLDECPLVPPFYSADLVQGAFEEWLGPEPGESADEDQGDEPELAPEVPAQLTPLDHSILDMKQALAELFGPDWRAQPTEPTGTEGMTMEQQLDALGF